MKILSQFFKENNTYFFLLGIICISLFLALLTLGNEVYHKILLTNTLDFSWTSDSIERLLHGKLAGRDFIFTYGPLFQILYSLPSLIFNVPSYLSPLIASILFQIPLCLMVFYVAGFVSKTSREQLLLTVILQFWIGIISFPDANNLMRIMIPFVYAVAYMTYTTNKKTLLSQVILLLALPSIFGLYSYDLFVICIVISILMELYLRFTEHKKPPIPFPKIMLFHGLSIVFRLVIILLFQLCVSLLLSNGLTYITSSLDTLRSYQYIMNIPLSLLSNSGLLIYVVSLIFLMWYIHKISSFPMSTKNNIFILSMVALLQLKTVLIRTDEGHLISAIYPSMIVTFIILFKILKQKVSLKFFSFFFILLLFIPYKMNYLSLLTLNSITGLQKITNTNSDFFTIYKLPENYYYTKNDFTYFSNLITKNRGKVMIYPYDSFILNIYHDTYNTYALQFYEYSNSPVEKISVEKLKKNPPRYIILGIDTLSAQSIDDIPNFSRNPLITKWMLTNYSVYEKKKKYLILEKKEKKKNSDFATNYSCDVYEINTLPLMKPSIYENVVKTSTYYLSEKDKKNIRLPYSPYSNSILLVSDFYTIDKIEALFSRTWNFTNAQETNKKKTILKKYPFPKIKKEITTEVITRCY